ncbi:MAG: hypothetical protein M5U27_10850 [Gaiella sp.]|nr:hypothetical protein [Gaiella sp.]
MGRNVLVVSAVEQGEHVLRSYLGQDVDDVRVVVPVVQQGFLDWLANDERVARAEPSSSVAGVPVRTIVVRERR